MVDADTDWFDLALFRLEKVSDVGRADNFGLR